MKKGNFEINGEIYRVTEVKGGKVEITLATETDSLIYVYLPRRCCNPHRWSTSDFIKVTGTIIKMEDSDEGVLNKIEFSQAIIKRLFTIETGNQEIDYCSVFTLNGRVENVFPVDKDNYELTLVTAEGTYTIQCDSYTLFRNITKLDLNNEFMINGVVYITKYSHYSYKGNVVSRINYVATNIAYS